MSLIKSLLIQEAKFNPLTILHGALYAATVSYLRILKIIVALGPQRLRTRLGETCHCKVLRLDDAMRLITINQDIELGNLDQVLPYRHARISP